jgi:hypothetical protein
MSIFRKHRIAVQFHNARQAQSRTTLQRLAAEEATLFHRLLMSNLAECVRRGFEETESGVSSSGGMAHGSQVDSPVRGHVHRVYRAVGVPLQMKVSNLKVIRRLKDVAGRLSKFSKEDQKSGAAELYLSQLAARIHENSTCFESDF